MVRLRGPRATVRRWKSSFLEGISSPAVTLFEKIAAGVIPAKIVGEGVDWIAFHDADPQAPVHFLVVPKRPIPRLSASLPNDSTLLGTLLAAAASLARQEGLQDSGYRVVINSGPDAGESVPHLHVHVLGGRHMTWPPG